MRRIKNQRYQNYGDSDCPKNLFHLDSPLSKKAALIAFAIEATFARG